MGNMMMLTVLVVLFVAHAVQVQAKQHTGGIRGAASGVDDDLRKLVGFQLTRDIVLDDGSPMRPCQDNTVKLERSVGSTPFPVESIEVVSVASSSTEPSTVTVDLKQSWTDGTLDSIFAYYHESIFDRKCYEHTGVSEGIFDEITITCSSVNPVAMLEICVADSFSKNVLATSDAATIPECCYPELSPETGSVCYVVLISCEPCEKTKTPEPTMEPTAEPTIDPTATPTKSPTPSPTENPTFAPTKNPTSPPTDNPTSSPTKNPTLSPTINPTPAPTICDHEITCPETPPQVSSTSWRLFATPRQLDDGLKWEGQSVWDLKEIKFYSNVGCTAEITRNGTPLNSAYFGTSTQEYVPQKAFQSSGLWGGRPDPITGNLWIGMTFSTPKTVKCVRVKNANSNAASQFWVQALKTGTNEWEDVWNGRDLSQGNSVWNERALDVDVITLHPWNKCEDTYSCQNGAFVEDYGIQPCPAGQLFDVEVGECRNEETVSFCPLDCMPPTPSPTNNPTPPPTREPTPCPTTARPDCSNAPSRTGPWVWDGCKTGFFCRSGEIHLGLTIPCPPGTLFDITRSDCYPADTVDCPVC